MTLELEKVPGDFRGLIPSGRDTGELVIPGPPRDPAPVLALTVLGAHDRATMTASLGMMTVSAELEQTIEGASTLTVVVADPARRLIRSGACSSAARVAVGGRRFLLASVQRDPGSPTLTLTFEAEAVALLRRYTKPRAMYRDKVTRAQFLESLVREVKERRLAFSAPHDYRIITARAATPAPATTNNANAAATAGTAENFRAAKVKGTLADGEQRRLLALAMRICDELDVPYRLRIGLIATMTQESVIRSPNTPDSYGSVGVLQAIARPGYAGQKAYDDEWQIRELFNRGFTGSHGYEGVLKSYRLKRWGENVIVTILHHLNPGAIGGSLEHNYRQWWDEASRTARLWTGSSGSGGSSSGDGSGNTHTTVERYAFRRGQTGSKENSWEAMRRLADEVNWALWIDGDTVHYAPEDWLRARAAKWTIAEGAAGLDGIGYTIDHGRVKDELRATVHADRWQVRIGDAAVVDGEGPADGKWLVTGIRRSLYAAEAELTLRRASKALPEPAPQTTTTTDAPDTGSGGGTGTPAAQLRARIVQVAQDQVGHGYGGEHYGAGGAAWCGYFASWVWRKAGVTGVDTYPMAAGAWDAGGSRRHYRPSPGDTIHYGRQHVGIVVKVEGDQVWTVEGNYSHAVSRRGPFHYRGYPPGGPATIMGYVAPPVP